MSVRIDNKPFTAALNKIISVASHARNGAAMVHVQVLDTENAVITAYSAGITAQTSLAVRADAPGAFTLSARKALDLAKQHEPDAIFTFEIAPAHITLASAHGQYRINQVPPDDYPRPPKFSPEASINLDALRLSTAIKRVRAFIANGDVRQALNGALLRVRAGRAVLVGTDGHRLAEAIISDTGVTATDADLLIHREALLELDRICAGQTVTISYQGRVLRMSAGADVLFTKMIDAAFPNYDPLFPPMPERPAYVDRISLLNAVNATRTVLETSDSGVLLKKDVGAITVQSSEEAKNTGGTTIDAIYAGEPAESGFRASYLADALASIEDDEVSLNLAGGNSPLCILPTKTSTVRTLVMPMRVA